MKKTFNQIFFIRKSKSQVQQDATIYLRITVNSFRIELSTQRQCDPAKWSVGSSRVIGKSEEVRALNHYLETIQFRIYEIQKEFVASGIDYTGEDIKAKFLGISDKPRMLIEIYALHNKEFKALVGKEYASGTMKRFETCKTSMEKFIPWKYHLKDIDIRKLGYEFIHDYEFYLKTIQNCSHNTTMGYLKKLKKIIKQCVSKEWLEKDPFQSFKITVKETHRTYLTEDELEIMANKCFISDAYTKVRDTFLFSCFTGLSYSDVAKLTPKDIVKGIDGDLWIITTRKKTDTDARIPLLETAFDLIEKYKHDPEIVAKNKVLPILTNQKMNLNLKKIAKLCNFSKKLSFHCARHTFATTVTLTNGVPIETVGKMLGHRSLRTTQIYAKVVDTKVSIDMKSIKEKFSRNKIADNDTLSPVG